MRVRNVIIVLLTSLALAQTAYAQDHWVTTWTAAPQQPRGGGPPPAAQAAAAGDSGGREVRAVRLQQRPRQYSMIKRFEWSCVQAWADVVRASHCRTHTAPCLSE
jgi:hypothetical protein